MNKELVIADMHMHTAGPKGSDGRNNPQELVLAAREKLGGKGLQGAMALTDHDTVGNVREFFASCRENGIIAVGGIEISFKAELLDLRDSRIEPEIRTIAVNNMIAGQLLRTGYHFQFPPFTSGYTYTHHILTLEIIDHLHRENPESVAEKMFGRSDEKIISELTLLKNYIEAFHNRYQGTGKQYPERTDKGETLCYFPPGILPDMEKTIDKLNSLEWPNGRPNLIELINFLGTETGRQGKHFHRLVFILAHPLSIDITWWGKILSRIEFHKQGNVRLATTELSHPDLRDRFSGAEVINAAHPVYINQLTHDLTHEKLPFGLYQGLGPSHTGNSDTHDIHWLFAGYSLLEVEKRSPEAVLTAIKKGDVLPQWGLKAIEKRIVGNDSPFALWFLLSPFANEANADDVIPISIIKNMAAMIRTITSPRISDLIEVPTGDQAQEIWARNSNNIRVNRSAGSAR